MPRFFFDIEDNVSIVDEAGLDCADREAAKAEAYRRAATYGGDPANLRRSGVIVVTMRDDQGKTVLRVRLVCQAEAV